MNPTTILSPRWGLARRSLASLAGVLWAGTVLAGTPSEDSVPVPEGHADALHCVIMPHAVVEVSAGVSGRIETLLVERGDRVKEGQLVARLEAGVESANLALADTRAALDSEIHLREARLRFDRTRQGRVETLHRQRVASSHEHDEAQMNASIAGWQLRVARDNQRLARLERDRARELLRLRTVLSPISGVVTDRYRWPGEFVEEDPIVQVARLDLLRVEVIVPVAMYGQIREGMRAEVIPEPDPGATRIATVRLVDPMADPASGTFRVRLELPNPDYRVLSGIKCTTRFVMSGPGTGPASDQAGPAVETGQKPSHDGVPAAPPRNERTPQPSPDPVVPVPLRTANASPEARDGNDPAAPSGPGNASPSTGSRTVPAQVVAEAIPAVSDAEDSSGKSGCRTVGPLTSAAKARRVAVELAALGIRSTLREATGPAPNGYIVLTAPAQSRRAQRELAQRLRAKGISDLIVMGGGAYAGRIALGVYDGQRMAQRRRAELAARGFSTQVEMRTRTRAAWWLDLTGGPLERAAGALASIAPGLATGRSTCTAILAARE